MDGDFFGPLEYSGWFPWAALGLLVLVAAWYAYRLPEYPAPGARRGSPGAPAAVAAPDLARLRRDYLERIDAVDREAAAGTRSGRSAHQELSLLIRSFVRDASGVDATRMTLAELRAAGAGPAGAAAQPPAHGVPAAAAAIAALYPAAFAAGPASGAADAARTAREVVRSWN